MFKELLQGYDAGVLKAIAREHRLDIRGNKEAVVERLAQKLAQRDGIEHAWAQTRPAERALIARIQRAGGSGHAAALKRILLKERAVAATPSRGRHAFSEPYQGNPDYSGKPVFEDVIARLTMLGLVLSRGVTTLYKPVLGWEPGRELVIPDEVRLLLPEPPAGEGGEGEPARVAPSSARALQRDLARFCGFVRRSGKLDVTTQGWLYKKDVAELVKALGWPVDAKRDEAHHPRLFFVRQMLRALKLI